MLLTMRSFSLVSAMTLESVRMLTYDCWLYPDKQAVVSVSAYLWSRWPQFFVSSLLNFLASPLNHLYEVVKRLNISS